MTDLRIETASPTVEDTARRSDWRTVHNLVVATHHLTPPEVRERAGRHHLEVAYAGDVLVGCSTVRPPTDASATATVIARVLPAHRRRGFGSRLYARGLERAGQYGAAAIETVVLESNQEGLEFALRRGFTEIERYLLPGEAIGYVELRLS
ncbi:GNAT family N-acetyltransferase [Streptomyces sp. NPDC006879]|uniref:GNAT family N-acetyltransferase n=1 Tax=Streptomyces sp. NPDC006879 TaxID=3364767 RepID=UPI0036A1503E